MRIYFDHNATTPVDSAVAETIARVMTEEFGNASSVHHFGQRAKAVLDEARSSVAALIGGEPSEVVFTSGGTESDNFALRGVAEALEPTGRTHLIASSIEHEAILVTLRALARRGWNVTLLPVDTTGILNPESLKQAMTSDTAIESVMHANNEIGTIQPIAECATIAHARGAAATPAAKKLTTEAPRITALRDRLEADILARVPGTAVNGAREPRVPN